MIALASSQPTITLIFIHKLFDHHRETFYYDQAFQKISSLRFYAESEVTELSVSKLNHAILIA